MLMNKISESMLESLLKGDMKEIAEKLTLTQLFDEDFIVNGTTKDLKDKSINVYINIANYIESHCKTSMVTDTVNTFLANNNSKDVGYMEKFEEVCKSINLSSSCIYGKDTNYTSNHYNDLSSDFKWRVFDDGIKNYILIEVNLGTKVISKDTNSSPNFSETVFLELNDIEYFLNQRIEGWIKETKTVYHNLESILEDTVEIKDDCFYNEDGLEILLSAYLYY